MYTLGSRSTFSIKGQPVSPLHSHYLNMHEINSSLKTSGELLQLRPKQVEHIAVHSIFALRQLHLFPQSVLQPQDTAFSTDLGAAGDLVGIGLSILLIICHPQFRGESVLLPIHICTI